MITAVYLVPGGEYDETEFPVNSMPTPCDTEWYVRVPVLAVDLPRYFDLDCNTHLVAAFKDEDDAATYVTLEVQARERRSEENPQDRCPYTHSHTRHWCGFATCRES